MVFKVKNAPLNYWYLVGKSSDLAPESLKKITLLGQPLVLWRSQSGKLSALVDRCSHRSVPLSKGRVINELIECPYHGQTFKASGECHQIPGILQYQPGEQHKVKSYPIREQQELIWVYASSENNDEVLTFPYKISYKGVSGYLSDSIEWEYEGHFLDGLENSADTIHTNFVHHGLFYAEDSRAPIDIELVNYTNNNAHGIEAIYHGEKASRGIVAKLLFGKAKDDQDLFHRERYIAPCIHQVEYKFGNTGHIFADVIYTPIAENRTKITVIYWIKKNIFIKIILPIIRKLFMQIINQDCYILEQQFQNRLLFENPKEVSNRCDLFALELRKYIESINQGQTLKLDKCINKRINLFNESDN